MLGVVVLAGLRLESRDARAGAVGRACTEVVGVVVEVEVDRVRAGAVVVNELAGMPRSEAMLLGKEDTSEGVKPA